MSDTDMAKKHEMIEAAKKRSGLTDFMSDAAKYIAAIVGFCGFLHTPHTSAQRFSSYGRENGSHISATQNRNASDELQNCVAIDAKYIEPDGSRAYFMVDDDRFPVFNVSGTLYQANMVVASPSLIAAITRAGRQPGNITGKITLFIDKDNLNVKKALVGHSLVDWKGGISTIASDIRNIYDFGRMALNDILNVRIRKTGSNMAIAGAAVEKHSGEGGIIGVLSLSSGKLVTLSEFIEEESRQAEQNAYNQNTTRQQQTTKGGTPSRYDSYDRYQKQASAARAAGALRRMVRDH